MSSETQKLNIRILRRVDTQVKKTISEIHETNDKHFKILTLGKTTAMSSLLRLEQSFYSTILLLKRGYIYEANIISRFILEQLAWTYAIDSSKDDEYTNIKASKCISTYKEVFELAGQVYGSLSKYSHLDLNPYNNYVSVNDDGFLNIPKNYKSIALPDCVTLFVLSELFNFNYEYLFRDVISDFKNLKFLENREIAFYHQKRNYKFMKEIQKALNNNA